MLNSAAYKTIEQTPDSALLQDARAIVVNVMRDLGISRQPDAYDGARFVDILKQYYGGMTIVDIKQAFEMYVMGELDADLPKGKDGAGFSHYQQFSASFYTKVLQAYRNRQLQSIRSVEGRMRLALVAESEAIRDKAADRMKVYDILEKAALDLSNGEEATLIMTAVAEAVYKQAALLPKEIVPSDADIVAARQGISRNKDSAVSAGLRNAMQQGTITDDLYAAASSVAAKRLLRKACEDVGAAVIKDRFEALRNIQTPQ
jgi:hypothetical protein